MPSTKLGLGCCVYNNPKCSPILERPRIRQHYPCVQYCTFHTSASYGSSRARGIKGRAAFSDKTAVFTVYSEGARRVNFFIVLPQNGMSEHIGTRRERKTLVGSQEGPSRVSAFITARLIGPCLMPGIRVVEGCLFRTPFSHLSRQHTLCHRV